MQDPMLVKSSHIIFESKANILDIVGELKAVELSDDEDDPSEEEETARIDGDDASGGQLTQDPTSLRTSSRLAQRRGANHTQQRFKSSVDSSFDEGNASPPFYKMKTKTHSVSWE